MTLRWTDTTAIAEALREAHPQVDPLRINFVDLMRWVTELPEFGDDPKRCNERILEAIQAAWIGVVEDEED